ncbi:MAG: precorrin-3B C(17)-methyltransferase [Deltaproteobacteria bacterium]|nr:precorrin-3B C(17)-methyltransferase [Kofleriaceae bacterium]
MTRIGRLAGALLVETGGAWFLVGHLKQPCDFAAAGFAPPLDLDARAPTGVRLEPIAAVSMPRPWLELALEGEAVVPLCARRLLVERTGLVSERLWRLVTETSETSDGDARWLGEVPDAVWAIVRDAVLRCS